MNNPQEQVKGKNIKKEKNMFEEWGEQMNEANKKAKKDLKKFKKNVGEAVDDHKDIILVAAGVGVTVGVILIVALVEYCKRS